ncbi:thymidine phosphorylase [Thioclava sp. SK-1]|uniref:thymidine phosphorylase n=1 Tax=Thioclava sp. SK-1 TaxID=1889770 RepID=UPI000825D818|nr:thymidine phosphorylase [Thioclava sp. SK-1]OCX66748.1 thymidine phosphorylase [Thioclava sp. SK-1]
MDARRIIQTVRDGGGLSAEDARWFAHGLANDQVGDAQAGAFAMAVLLRGIGVSGRVALTEGMRDSGQVLNWDLPGPVIDKHSTGGVGDCVSLLLAPALAACGCYVPMISGRGLGHTGGTLDKMEAIPGYRVDHGVEGLQKIVGQVGCAIAGASDAIAPADRRLYAVRDICGAVESIDLITPSILSKKLAAGLQGLVLDVKVGSGAFMTDMDDARALARALVETANGAGCKTSALITDMNQSLSRTAGNALEVIEVLETLTGQDVNDALWDVTSALGGEALLLAGIVKTREDGFARIDQAIESGQAAEYFGKMVAAMGGPADFVERFLDRLPSAPVLRPVPAARDGVVSRIDARILGEAVVDLGGGRLRAGDKVNPSVGLSGLARIGQQVEVGEPIALIHAATEEAAQACARVVQRAYHVGAAPVPEPNLIHERITQ